jgi:hypothetical protein
MIYKEQKAIFTDIAMVCSFGLRRVFTDYLKDGNLLFLQLDNPPKWRFLSPKQRKQARE